MMISCEEGWNGGIEIRKSEIRGRITSEAKTVLEQVDDEHDGAES